MQINIDSITNAADEMALKLLRSQYYDCLEEIDNLSCRIKQCENAYDSISLFKNTVNSDYEQFRLIRDKRYAKLADLENLRKDCRTAAVYMTGCSDSLNGDPWSLRENAFNDLNTVLANKQRSLTQSVLSMEMTQASKRIQATQLKSQIDKLEAKILGEDV